MAVHHVIRCDFASCRYEATVLATSGGKFTTALTGKRRRHAWVRLDDLDFCSWECVMSFAAGEAARSEDAT